MFKNKRTAIALIAAGVLVLALASFAGAETSSSTANSASNVHRMALTVSASGKVMLRGTLQSVGTNSIVVTSWGGSWTVNIGSDAKLVRRFGGASSLSEFQAGDDIQVNGAISRAAAWTVDAKIVKDNSIQARNADFTGTISGLNGSAFTLTTPRRGDIKVTVNADAKITVNGKAATVSDLANGQRVRVKGVWDRTQSTVAASNASVYTPKAGGGNSSSTSQ